MRLLVGGEPQAGRTVSPVAQTPVVQDEPASPPTNSPACQYITDTVDVLIEELDRVISRHFALERTIVVERESIKHWIASIDDDVLYRSPDGPATLRFARTFASRTPGVTVAVAPELHSVKV